MTERSKAFLDARVGAFATYLMRILFPRAAKIAAGVNPIDPEARRFCRDCTHRRDDRFWPGRRDHDGCVAPSNLTVDLVSGQTVRGFRYCATLRASNGIGYCGTDAQWFEPKQTTPPADAGATQEA